MNEYMRNDLEDTYGILPLQNKILEIIVYLDSVCKKHNIKYYLMGGSALGAMRHKGFIPWDDDLDIFMPYKDYMRFVKLSGKILDKKKFYFQREDSVELPYFFSKLRMNGTTCMDEVNKHKKNMHQGIFVDIMCLNNAAPTSIGKKIQYYAAGLLKANAITKTEYKTDDKKKKVELAIAKICVRGPIKKLLLWLVRRYNKKSAAEVAHLFGRAKYKNSFYLAKDFTSQKYVSFEKVELAVSNGVDRYLKTRYGEKYMEMPSEETKAMYTSHAMVWDVERDYTYYLQKEKNDI